MTWWQAAKVGCDDVGGVLLPRSNISQNLMLLMLERQAYWIGAEGFTSRRWTGYDDDDDDDDDGDDHNHHHHYYYYYYYYYY